MPNLGLCRAKIRCMLLYCCRKEAKPVKMSFLELGPVVLWALLMRRLVYCKPEIYYPGSLTALYVALQCLYKSEMIYRTSGGNAVFFLTTGVLSITQTIKHYDGVVPIVLSHCGSFVFKLAQHLLILKLNSFAKVQI